MTYLIVKVMVVGSDAPPVAVLRRPHAARDPTVSAISDMLESHGMEVGQIGGPYTGFPMIAIAYTSPNRDGIGRAGSQTLRIPVRRGVD